MKKHTIKFTLNSVGNYTSTMDDELEMCMNGLKRFLDFGQTIPTTLYVTLSSQKFKNSFPITLIRHLARSCLLKGVKIDSIIVVTSGEQDHYLLDLLYSFKDNPTIHILFEMVE